MEIISLYEKGIKGIDSTTMLMFFVQLHFVVLKETNH